MTRYNITALDEAFGASDDHVKVPDVERIFDSLERAPWWEEAEVGYEFTHGEPYRVESPTGIASERTATYTFTISTAHQAAYFRDTRWQPPVKPLKVGDLIDTKEQAESLPIGTIAVSMANETIRKADMDEWRRVNAERGFLLADFEMAGQGDRIIHLPSEVSMSDLNLVTLREIAEPPPCPNHREVQHRDRKPPWCPDCGWNRGRPAAPPRQIDARADSDTEGRES